MAILITSLMLIGMLAAPSTAQIKTWRVGGPDHPWNLAPVSGRLDWGRGWALEILQDERGNSWLSPIHLDSTRNVAVMVNQLYLQGELGGIVPGNEPRNPFMVIPSEFGYRNEPADPISADNFFERRAQGTISRLDYGVMVDGDPFTAFGSAESEQGGVAIKLPGYYYINRLVFYPRPTLPTATLSDYWIRYGDPTTINPVTQTLRSDKTLVSLVTGEFNPTVKDLRFTPPVLIGRIDIDRRVARGIRVETAEVEMYGEGFPLDGRYTSEIIDVGLPLPRVRRYSREIEQFRTSERNLFEQEFPDQPGALVNWGKVRWRGRRQGASGSNADVRIQFRVGNSLDTHLYARSLGPNLTDTYDVDGNLLDLFAWITLTTGRVPEKDLPYNELGVDLGPDRRLGWSYWSAPFKFEDGLIPEDLPPEQWSTIGVPLPLPGGTRYLQFRILFDSEQYASTMFDFIEFEYATPLVSGGVKTEIYPGEAPLGEELTFHYYLQPSFAAGETTQFNRLEIDVPSIDTRVVTLLVDGQTWEELPVPELPAPATDPLAIVDPQFTLSDRGQFAQAMVRDPATGTLKLLLKLAPLNAQHFHFDEYLEIVFVSKLFQGAQRFTSVLWNDRLGERNQLIPQPTEEGDVLPEVPTDAVLVVASEIDRFFKPPQVSPNPFTPNGDGINDEVDFVFDLYLIIGAIQTRIEIFDLAGRRVRLLGPVDSHASTVKMTWDGRDQSGALLPPGIYLYQLMLDSDRQTYRHRGTVSLAF